MSVINTNITSMIGQSNLQKSQNALQTSMERIRELTSIQDEIDRISEETSFNGVDVLASDQGLQIQVGANDGQTITVDGAKAATG